jgi:hypothetical protein
MKSSVILKNEGSMTCREKRVSGNMSRVKVEVVETTFRAKTSTIFSANFSEAAEEVEVVSNLTLEEVALVAASTNSNSRDHLEKNRLLSSLQIQT